MCSSDLESPTTPVLMRYQWAQTLIADIRAGNATIPGATPVGDNGGDMDAVNVLPQMFDMGEFGLVEIPRDFRWSRW